MSDYSKKLRDPRWQKRRLEIMNRDGFACRRCGSKTTTLNVHHLVYRKGFDPWDYDGDDLLSLCEECHEQAEDPETMKGFRLFMALCRGDRLTVRSVAAMLSSWAEDGQDLFPEPGDELELMHSALACHFLRTGFYKANRNWETRLSKAGLLSALNDFESGGAK